MRPFSPQLVLAHRAGTRYHFILDWHDQGLREWVRLSLPLMAGVSLVTADNWIIAHFASTDRRRGLADELRQAVFHRAHGHAGAGRWRSLLAFLCQPCGRAIAVTSSPPASPTPSLAWPRSAFSPHPCMVALGWPAIDLVFTGGRFSPDDARLCAAYFAVFSVSLFLWSAQAIYSRAFYAAGNTFVPMVASTIVTVVSLPIYDVALPLARRYRAWPSLPTSASRCKLSPSLCCCTKRRMVSLASLDYAEMGRCLLGAFSGGAAAWFVAWSLAGLFHRLPRLAELHHARSIADTAILIGGTAIWTAVTMWVLDISGSALPRVALRRLRLS